VTPSASHAQPSLSKALSGYFANLAIFTVVILSATAFLINYMDYDHLYLDHVSEETNSLLRGVIKGPDGLSFSLPQDMARFDEGQSAYGFRVLDETGRVIAGSQAALIEKVSPWSPGSPITTDSWFVRLEHDKTFHFAGGRRLRLGDTDVLVEMMTLGDPEGVHRWVVLHETAEDIWLPILPLALLMPALTIFSIRRALAPLAGAAHGAETINPADPTQRLEVARMPRETAAFASAINRLMDRVGTLVQSQKIFIASAAHELRTPLAVMLLELEKIDDARARRLEQDVKGMAECVNRLVLLARLEMVQSNPVDLDLGAVAVETIDRLQPWAATQQHRIDLRLNDPRTMRGDRVAVREALANLVENAVKHTPAGTAVSVTVGPGNTITVEDSGPGLATEATEELFQPFRKGNSSTEGAGLGLTIVRQAVELHRGSIQIGRSALGGAMFTLKFA
jgi:signal transduction histidine kinase